MSLVGIVEGVGGRGCIKERGVLGGSKLGIVLFHACTKAWSSACGTGASVEKGRRILMDRARSRAVALRNMSEVKGIRSARKSERFEGVALVMEFLRFSVVGVGSILR